MSKTRKETIKCPECGNEQEVVIWDSVNVQEDPEAKEKILKNEFFMFECAECGQKVPMAYTCLYHDTQNKLLVYMVPDYDEKEEGKFKKMIEDMGNVLPDALNLGYSNRIAPDANTLREKILIKQEGLDDRVIEMMKLYYVAQAQESLEDSEILSVLFESSNAVNGFVFLLKDKNPMFGEINMEAYEMLEKDFKEKIEKSTPEGFAEIDVEWAKKLTFEE